MDPVLELQGAIVSRLRNYAPLSALIGAKVYDNPPVRDNGTVAPATYPYVSIGPSSFTPEDADCVYGGEAMIQLDVWSSDSPSKQVRDIANLVRLALRGWEPPLTENALVTFEHWRTDYLRNADINHASLRFTALIEQP